MKTSNLTTHRLSEGDRRSAEAHFLLRFLFPSVRAGNSVLFILLGWNETVYEVRESLFGLLYQPRMLDNDKHGGIGGMVGKEGRSTRRKPAPLPLRPPQIPQGVSWTGTPAATLGSQKLAACTSVTALLNRLSIELCDRPD
jgi:hypothetical protein